MNNKFSPPEAQQRVLIRQRLLDVALARQNSRVTLIHAPAGYGKTAFMMQWHQALVTRGERVAWLTLTSAEEPAHFFAGILLRALGEKVGFADAAPHSEHEQRFLQRNRAFAEPLTIFADDFDTVESADSNKLLSRFAAEGNGSVHIVLGSRSMPGCASERLKLQGRIREFGTKALRFAAPELEHLFGKTLSDGALQAEVAEAEGWPIAVHLAHLLHGCDADAQLAPQHSSDWARSMADYFLQEIFDPLPEELRNFLLDVSVLETMRPELCDFLRQQPRSALHMNQLHTQHAVLHQVDSLPGALRLPTLHRKALLTALTTSDPQRAAHLHQRASSWYERHDDFAAAIRHALAVDDSDLAARIIERAGGIRLAFRLGPSACRTILEQLPKSLQLSNPRIACLQAFQLLKHGEIDEARALARIVGIHAREVTDKDRDFVVDQAMLELLFAVDVGPIDDSLTALVANTATELNPVLAAEIESYGASVASYAYQQIGELRRASTALSRWCHINGLLDWGYSQLFAELQWGAIAVARGHLGVARDAYQRTLAAAERNYSGEHGLRQVTRVLLAEVEYLAGRSVEARKLLAQDFRDIEEYNCWYDIRAVCYALQFRLLRDEESNGAAVLARHAQIMDHIRAHGLQGLDSLVNAEAAVAALRFGDRTAAAELFRQLPVHPEEGGGSEAAVAWRTDDALLRAHGLRALENKQPEVAVLLASRWAERARREERTPALMAALTVTALAHHALGSSSDAAQAFREALHHAAAIEAPQPILDLAVFGVDQLLEHASATDPLLPQLARSILDRSPSQRLATAARVSQPGSLSNRELAVLQAIQRGESNKSIARHLQISENTVKFHTKNLFRKLGVSDRRGARAGAATPIPSQATADAPTIRAKDVLL